MTRLYQWLVSPKRAYKTYRVFHDTGHPEIKAMSKMMQKSLSPKLDTHKIGYVQIPLKNPIL